MYHLIFKMRHIIFAGLSNTGKTTQARWLAESLQVKYICGSQIRAEELDVDHVAATDPDFWRDSELAVRLDRARLAEIDPRETEVERKLAYLVRNGNDAVFDTWVLPWLCRDDSLCIYLRAEVETRVGRACIASPDVAPETMRQRMTRKDDQAAEFFQKAYGVDIMGDLTPFHLVVDCNEAALDKRVSAIQVRDGLKIVAESVRSGGLESLAEATSEAQNLVSSSICFQSATCG